MKGWELVTPAERRLAVLLFALAVLGQFAHWGSRASPDVARWLQGDPTPPAGPKTVGAKPESVLTLSPVTALDTTAGITRSKSRDTTSTPVGDIDPNTADRVTLMRLPGVGPVLADRILADRAQSGPYERPEDLLRVPGIGPAKLAKLRAHLVFGHARGG